MTQEGAYVQAWMFSGQMLVLRLRGAGSAHPGTMGPAAEGHAAPGESPRDAAARLLGACTGATPAASELAAVDGMPGCFVWAPRHRRLSVDAGECWMKARPSSYGAVVHGRRRTLDGTIDGMKAAALSNELAHGPSPEQWDRILAAARSLGVTGTGRPEKRGCEASEKEEDAV